MNQDQVEGSLSQWSGKIREKWGLLTDNDMTVANGRHEALLGRLQERYGIAKEEAEKQLADFTRTVESSTPSKRTVTAIQERGAPVRTPFSPQNPVSRRIGGIKR